jgi:hypothetical protein
MDCFAGPVIGRRCCADPAARNDVEIVGQIMRRTALRTGSVRCIIDMARSQRLAMMCVL